MLVYTCSGNLLMFIFPIYNATLFTWISSFKNFDLLLSTVTSRNVMARKKLGQQSILTDI